MNLTINPVPIVNLGLPQTQCEGTVTLDAGNTGSTYVWNTAETTQTIIVNSTNTYSVTVTNPEGCSASSSVLITINSNPIVALGADVIQCGGTVTLNAQNAGQSFVWNNLSTGQTLTANTSGTYFVTVTDGNGCSGSDTIDVVIHTTPTVVIAQPSAICAPGSILVDAGTGFASYTWSDGSLNQILSTSNSGN